MMSRSESSTDCLTSESYGDGLPNASASWSYEAAGNRNDATTDNLNRTTALGGAAVTSDVLGNRMTKGGVTYGWDALNRLTSLSGGVATRYRHDGAG